MAFFPLVTSLVALAFGIAVLAQYRARRGIHQLVWGVALLVFAFAAFCEFYSEVWGWSTGLYRVYYVAAAALTAEVDVAALAPGVTVAGRAMPASVRLFSPLLTVPGSVALIGGAVQSAWVFRRNRAYGNRVVANVLIAAGAIVIAGAGASARFGVPCLLYPAEMVGIILMFVGFTRAGTIRR